MEIIENNEEKRYFDAKKRVEQLKGFYGNLISYIIINIFFLVINLLTSPEHLWFFWPLFGWGIGVFLHGWKVFYSGTFLGKEWEERKIKEYMEKEKKSTNYGS